MSAQLVEGDGEGRGREARGVGERSWQRRRASAMVRETSSKTAASVTWVVVPSMSRAKVRAMPQLARKSGMTATLLSACS
ncbi:hypothetical protein ACFQZC_34685 [Streptacidiphilus monticola]